MGRLLGGLLLGVNFCVVAGLLVCAYSSYVDPTAHPVLSCAGLAFPVFLVMDVLFLLFWCVIRRRYAWFSLAGLIGVMGAIRTYVPVNPFVGEVPDGAIKVLSYNIMGFGKDGKGAIDSFNSVLEYLRQSRADIICLQEYTVDGKLKQQDVDKALRDYPYRHYAKANGLGCYSRFPILSARPVSYASARNGSIAYEIKVEADTLLVINNHLESNKLTEADKEVYRKMMKDPDNQKVSAGSRQLLKKLAEASAIRAPQADSVARLVADSRKKGIIVCGDFNDSPLSYAHRVIGKTLDDAFVQSGNGPGISYNRNRFYFRIDHILLSRNLRAYRCKVDKSIKSSDHYPVWCHVAKK